MPTDIRKTTPDTWTRAELLRMRGYPEAIISGAYATVDQGLISGMAPIELEPDASGPGSGEVGLRSPENDPLGGIYRALMAEGASIETLIFRLHSSEIWTITRSSTNGKQTP